MNAGNVNLPIPGFWFAGDNPHHEAHGTTAIRESTPAGNHIRLSVSPFRSTGTSEAEIGAGYGHVWYDKFQCGHWGGKNSPKEARTISASPKSVCRRWYIFSDGRPYFQTQNPRNTMKRIFLYRSIALLTIFARHDNRRPARRRCLLRRVRSAGARRQTAGDNSLQARLCSSLGTDRQLYLTPVVEDGKGNDEVLPSLLASTDATCTTPISAAHFARRSCKRA